MCATSTALEQSGLIERLLQIIGDNVGAFGATEVTLTLDGLARLRQQPSSLLLDALAKQVCTITQHPFLFVIHVSDEMTFCRNHRTKNMYSWCSTHCSGLACPLQACEHAKNLQASQVPLILWAFAMLNYNPLVAVLAALDQQVERLSTQITAQVRILLFNSRQSCFTT